MGWRPIHFGADMKPELSCFCNCLAFKCQEIGHGRPTGAMEKTELSLISQLDPTLAEIPLGSNPLNVLERMFPQ